MREYGAGTIDRLPSGRWRGRVSTPDGRRVAVTRDTEDEVRRELRRLAGKVAAGEPVASTQHTVRSWLAVWLEEARPNLSPRTYEHYEACIRLYINPVLGRRRLTELKPEHVTAMVRTMQDRGLSPATAARARAVLRRALKIAQRYGHVAVNVVTLTDPPRQVEPERPHLTADQARAVLAAAAQDRLRARHHVALYLGLRQGELLGLRWQDVDLDRGTLAVRQQLQRMPWKHGCQHPAPAHGKAAACGRTRGADCPQRHSGGVVASTPKSKAGRRVLPLPQVLRAELAAHRQRQELEREHAGPLWDDHGLVFCQPTGRPLDKSWDAKAWRALLVRSGAPAMGTHAARRTCATLLLEAGVDPRTVAEIIGHSSVALTMNVYQQTGEAILRHGTDAAAAALAAAPPPDPVERLAPVIPLRRRDGRRSHM
jgi:integrase